MKIANIAAGFVATLLAAPAVGALPNNGNCVGVKFTNDKTGANANKYIPVDHSFRIPDVWAGTDIEKDGCVWVTSWMLVRFDRDTHCKVWNDLLGHHSDVNARKTWSWLKDGEIAVCLNDHAWIRCSNSEII